MKSKSNCALQICLVASGLIAAPPADAGTYPTRHTVPYAYFVAKPDRQPLFDSIQTMVALVAQKPALIVEVYMIKNAEDSDATICGRALIGQDRQISAFVIAGPKEVYIDVDPDGLQSLGCATKGGFYLAWRVRKDGLGADIE